MNNARFTEIMNAQIDRCYSLLAIKQKEYNTDEDRLKAFKQAAAMLSGTPEQALLGMLAKHLTSIIKMINGGERYPEAVWNEKITDAINYLILLRALVEETARCEGGSTDDR